MSFDEQLNTHDYLKIETAYTAEQPTTA